MNERLYPSRLAAKVAAKNEANQVLKDLMPEYLECFRAWIGRKILRTDGATVKEFDKLRPVNQYNGSRYVQVSLLWDTYSVRLHIQVSNLVDGKDPRNPQYCTSVHQEAYAYVADFKGANVEKAHDFNPDAYRTDYTEAEIAGLRYALTAAKQEVSRCNSRLDGFGEYDN